MPIGDQSGLKEGVQKGLALAIPLVLQKRRLDAAEGEFNQKMMMKRLELVSKGIEAKDKIQADFYTSTFKAAMETSDEESAGSAMKGLEKFGIQFEIPKNFEGKAPTSLEGKAIRGMSDEEARSLLKEKIAKSGTKPGVPRFYQSQDDPNKIITIQGNEMPPEGFVPYTKPGAGKSPKDMTTERRMTSKDVANAEKKISEGDMAQVDFFNQYAKKPYVYIQTEGESPYNIMGLDIPFTGGDPGTKTIKLPKFQGKQVYAEDVYQTMIDNDMTFEEVLREIGAIK